MIGGICQAAYQYFHHNLLVLNRRNEIKKLILTILLLSFGQAQAQTAQTFQTGGMLLEDCEARVNGTNNVKGAACVGYVMGIDDVHATFTGWKRMDKEWCLPDGVHSDQLVRVVVKHLQKYPEDLHWAAGSLVGNAFNTAFPCEEGV